MKQISVGFGPELIEKLKREAKRRQNSAHKKTVIPAARVVRDIVEKYFERKRQSKQVRRR